MIVNENCKLVSSSQTILCMKEEMNPKLKEEFKKQRIQQIDETNNIKLKLNKDTESSTKQKIASKENQDDIKRSNEIRKLPETRAGKRTVHYLT